MNDLNLVKDISIRDRLEGPCFVGQDKEKDCSNGQISRLLKEQETHPPMSRAVLGHCQRRYLFGEKGPPRQGTSVIPTEFKVKKQLLNCEPDERIHREDRISFSLWTSECVQEFTRSSGEFIQQPFLFSILYVTPAHFTHQGKFQHLPFTSNHHKEIINSHQNHQNFNLSLPFNFNKALTAPDQTCAFYNPFFKPLSSRSKRVHSKLPYHCMRDSQCPQNLHLFSSIHSSFFLSFFLHSFP